MTIMSRRFFLTASAAFPLGCALNRRSASSLPHSLEVRPPAEGQSWRYAKHDLYTGEVLDTQVDQVAAVERTVNIESRTEGAPDKPAGSLLGMNLPRPFGGREQAAAALPSEVQAPWGMILVDPHWSQVQLFETPIPLWPREFRPGWHAHINAKYTTVNGRAALPWQQTMKAEAWESIAVPAGRFTALRYINSINFSDGDPGRIHCARRETVWFAPEVGRWVARESTGSFYLDDSVADQPFNENGYRWELLTWT